MGGGYSCGGNPHPMVTSFRRSAKYQNVDYMAGFPGPLAASYGRAFIQKGRSESIGIGSGGLYFSFQIIRDGT